MTPDNCPHCKASLIGEEIPLEWRDCYGGKTRYHRSIALIDSERDRVVAYRCPDCGGEWGPDEEMGS